MFEINVKNSADNSRKELYIYGDIVDDSWNFGWDDDPSVYPLNIRDMLKDCNGEPVDVHINSGGGHMMAGMAIANMLKKYKGETTCYVDGIAASAASLIAFGCDKVVIPENAYLMMHKPMSYCSGNADELRKTIEMLNVLQDGAVALYAEKALEGVTKEAINEMVNAETWLTGNQAADYFNIKVTPELNALNCSSALMAKYVHAPKSITNNADKELERMRQAVEIELELMEVNNA